MERLKMKKKGFTLVELLVVIAIIAMLLAILMPALGKVRQLAQRIMCATNLSGIGKATLTYSTDDKYESFPVAGSSDATWDRGTGGNEGKNTFDWRNSKAFPEAIGTHTVTLSSHLYLLIKYADVSPDQFICPGSDLKKFQLNNYDMSGYTTATMTDVWDFGGDDATGAERDLNNSRNKGHQSYSYQSPVIFTNATAPAGETRAPIFPISNTSNPATPVMADRNPFWQTSLDPSVSTDRRTYAWDSTNKRLYAPTIPNGNSTYHQKDGQNVLYADQHSKFEKSANCGIESDNIYTVWGPTTTSGVIDPETEEWKRQCGKGAKAAAPPFTVGPLDCRFSSAIQTDNALYPVTSVDSYLVSDPDKDD